MPLLLRFARGFGWILGALVWGLVFSAAGESLEVSFSAPKKVSLGEPFAVSVRVKGEVEKATLSWRGRNLPLDLVSSAKGERRALALLGTDSAEKPLRGETLKIWIVSGGVTYMSKWSIDVAAKDYPSERLTVNPAMVSPPSDQRERIARERVEVRKALDTVSGGGFWKLPFVRPVPGAVTSVYGKKRIFNGIPKSRHGGVDYRAPIGTPVKSASAGRVILTGDHYYAGKSIYVDHGGAVISMYFHLSSVDVAVGQTVAPGEVIGRTGKTGRITGPHLHFGVAVGGRMVDPAPLLTRSAEDMIKSLPSGRMAIK